MALTTTGEDSDLVLPLNNPTDWVEIWTQRIQTPANEIRTLKLAKAVRTNLKAENGLEPIILLLTQPWFGAELQIPSLPGLRGLFVQYPHSEEIPALANLCERAADLSPKQTEELGKKLGSVLG